VHRTCCVDSAVGKTCPSRLVPRTTTLSLLVGYRVLRSGRNHSGRALSLVEFWLDFHGVLYMALQSCPSILYRSARRSARQLDQVLIEPLLLHLFEFLLALHGARPALQALALYLSLSRLDLAVCACVIETRECIC
jgi:hypothetical protein